MKRMRKKKQFRLPRWIALLVLTSGAARATAQSVDWGESEQNLGSMNLLPRLRYFETDMEFESDTYNSAGTSIRDERWYVSPVAGIEWDNYIYHPYLLNYSLLFEPGYIWQRSGEPGLPAQTTDELMLDGIFKVNLLEAKPYATIVSYSRSQDDVKYDFFNSATVDSQTWVVNSGYQAGPVPVNVSFQQSQMNSVSPGQNSNNGQTTVNLNAKNDRAMDDSTILTYQYGQFNNNFNVAGLSYNNDTSYQHLILTDAEHYRKSVLRSSLFFDDIQSPNSFSSYNLNAALDYQVQHAPHLSGDYDYSFTRYADNSSDSMQNTASAALHHQLYESLTSSFEIEGSSANSSSSGAALDSYSGQISASENYVKRLGDWGRLTIGESASYTVTDQEANGSQTVIANESHTVPTTGPIILTQPLDLSISRITDSTGTIILQPGLDYTVNESTDPWQIQINSAGPNHILPGATILVTYTVQTNPSGSYSVFNSQSEIRLGFWNGLADVYALYDVTENQASSPEFVLQNENEFQIGTDLNWHRLSLNANYTDDRSTLYDSRSYNLAENYTLMRSAHSRVGVNLGQQWDDYSFSGPASGPQNQRSTFYNFMLTCEWRPTGYLSWNAEGGLQRTYGSEVNQDLFAARTYLNWHMGKLEVHLGYEYENQNYSTEILKRNYAFLRIRRNF